MDALKEYLEKINQMFGEMDRTKKMVVGGGAGAFVLVLLLLTMSGDQSSNTEYLPLYADIDMKEAGELASRLREMNQDFKIGGDGSIVLVPEKDRLTLRNALATEGFPKTGFIGYEVFDEIPLGMTEFLQEVKHQQALEGELSRTIIQLKQVDNVRLHVVLPKASLFTDEEKPATASIILTLRHNMKLSRAQIQGIQRLVASSVEGLDPNRITVVDNLGNMLSEEMDPLARVTAKQLEIQRDVEAYLEKRTQDILNRVLGPDQAFVRITTELDFDQREETTESYDPEQSVTRSEQRSEESSAEAGTKENTVSNYEINSSIRRITGSVGGLKRMTAALMINEQKPVIGLDPGEFQTEPRTQDDITNITGIVRGAIGFDQSRNDLITVSTFQFATQDLKRAAAQEQQEALAMSLARVAAERERVEGERDALVRELRRADAEGLILVSDLGRTEAEVEGLSDTVTRLSVGDGGSPSCAVRVFDMTDARREITLSPRLRNREKKDFLISPILKIFSLEDIFQKN